MDFDVCFVVFENVFYFGIEEGIDWLSDGNGICGWGVMLFGMIVLDCGFGDYEKFFVFLK